MFLKRNQCLFWRKRANTAAAPESTRTMVPGSGTVSGGGSGLHLLFFGSSVPVFLGTQPAPPPPGMGRPTGKGIETPGGPGPTSEPPAVDPGPIGITGSPCNKLEPRLDGNSVPLATASGRSSSAINGSSGKVFACGRTDT